MHPVCQFSSPLLTWKVLLLEVQQIVSLMVKWHSPVPLSVWLSCFVVKHDYEFKIHAYPLAPCLNQAVQFSPANMHEISDIFSLEHIFLCTHVFLMVQLKVGVKGEPHTSHAVWVWESESDCFFTSTHNNCESVQCNTSLWQVIWSSLWKPVALKWSQSSITDWIITKDIIAGKCVCLFLF